MGAHCIGAAVSGSRKNVFRTRWRLPKGDTSEGFDKMRVRGVGKIVVDIAVLYSHNR